MSNKHLHRLAPTPSFSPQMGQRAEPKPSRKWSIVVMTVVGLALAVFAGVEVKRHFFPTYWTADDPGPIYVHSLTPPGPAPEGMVWIPGGTFWMGSDAFPDAKPVHK